MTIKKENVKGGRPAGKRFPFRITISIDKVTRVAIDETGDDASRIGRLALREYLRKFNNNRKRV